MIINNNTEMLINITITALLSDGQVYGFKTEVTQDLSDVLSFCSQLGSIVTSENGRITVQKVEYAENKFITIGECSDFVLRFLAGIAGVSNSTTAFNCGADSLDRLGKIETELLKDFGSLVTKTEKGFIVASAYTYERLSFPKGTDEAFICGLFIGSMLGDRQQGIYYNPDSLSDECKKMLISAFSPHQLITYFSKEGVYIS